MLAMLLSTLMLADAPVAQASAMPMVGGWSAVAQPAHDAEVQGAAAALVAHAPVPHAHLRRIVGAQRQVVAGTNVRLTVRLVHGGCWSATKWNTDGRVQVERYTATE
jgi:hypothetical protein